MMKNKYRSLNIKIKDTSEAPKGKEIFYRCTNCGSVISSVPNKNIGCECGNIFIDKDYFRLSIEDYDSFEAVRMIKKR